MPKYRFLALLVSVLSAFQAIDAYGLSLSVSNCKFYFAGDSSEDGSVIDLLKIAKSHGAVLVCTTGNERKSYKLATPVSMKNGVHYFHLRSVFNTPYDERDEWRYHPSKDSLEIATHEIYMRKDTKDIARQDSDGFIQTQGISTLLFSKLYDAWEKISSSEKEFKRHFSSYLSVIALFSSEIKSLKDALYSRNPGSRNEFPKLLSIGFVEGNDSSAPHYMLYLANKSHEWQVSFDFDGDAIWIEGIRAISLTSE